MSSWEDAFREEADALAKSSDTFLSLCHGFPNLAHFLSGTMDAEKGPKIPPGSLTLWMEDGKIKCCFKVKAKAMVGFSVVHDPQNLTAEFEAMLASDCVEWRREGRRVRS